jgi:hypothetical protein
MDFADDHSLLDSTGETHRILRVLDSTGEIYRILQVILRHFTPVVYFAYLG